VERLSEIGVFTGIGVVLVIALTKPDKTPLNSFLSGLLCIADSIGVAVFAIAGYNHGSPHGSIIAVLCGFGTACGGGILAATLRVLSGKSTVKVLLKTLAINWPYYLFGTTMSYLYGKFHVPGENDFVFLLGLAGFAVILGVIVESGPALLDSLLSPTIESRIYKIHASIRHIHY
jgi:uncharacterized membrane protein YeiH